MVRLYKAFFRLLAIAGFACAGVVPALAQCNFTNLNATYCTDEPAFPLTGGTNYYGPGVSSGSFDPDAAGPGTHTLYTTDGTTTSYTVSGSGSFDPDLTPGTPVTFPSAPADETSATLPIGFNFSFFGNVYGNLAINANGYVIFGGNDNENVSQSLPDAAAPNNIIAGAWDDLDITAGGTVTTAVVGSSPLRRFLINFNGVRHQGSAQTVSFQIQLHESTNVIEIHSQDIQFDGVGGMTQGIEDATGSAAYVVTGRNSASWTALNDFKAFVPTCFQQQSVTVYAAPNATLGVSGPAAVCSGTSASITIATSQVGVSYQLLRVSDDAVLSTVYAGTGSNLVIPSIALTAATDIKVYATNPDGCDVVVGLPVSVAISTPPAITGQPSASQVVCEGSAASFSVTATGTGLTYQWQKNGVNIALATSATYPIGAVTTASAGTYGVVVSGTCAPSVTSTGSVLTVRERPEITAGPANVTVCQGAGAVFSVNPGVTTNPTYQWYKGASPIASANASSYAITSVVPGDAGTYHVVVGGSCSPVATSANATLTVNTPPAITAQPAPAQSLCEGDPATFSVTATGTGPITYQWRKGGVDISGATSDTYNIPAIAATDAAIYTVAVTGACSPPIVSNNAVLTINETAEITTQPLSQSVCPGSPVTFTVDAGATTSPTYQWYKGASVIPSATGATYTIASVVAGDAGNYTVQVSGACGATVPSAVATLSVQAPPSITTQPTASQSLCEGVSASFTVVAAGTGPLTYQWKKNGVNISGATSASYNIGAIAAADAATYTVEVKGACFPVVISNGAVLTVNERPEITTQPVGRTVCEGSSVSFTVNAGITTNPMYQWYYGATPIGSATSATYTIPTVAAAQAGNYSVRVSGTCSAPVTSSMAALVVDTAPVITTQPSATQAVCEGLPASFSVVAAGTGLSYQWYKNGVAIASANADTYNIPATATADGATYTVTVSGTCTPPVTSNGAVLTIDENPEIATGPASQIVCAGSSVTFTVNAGATKTPSYQWYKGVTAISGANSASYTIPATVAADAGSYYVEVSGACGSSVNSASATLTVRTAPAITSQPAATQAICEGNSASFSVTATGTTLTYQWRKNGVNIASANASTYSIGAISAADAATYTVVITGVCGTPATSNASVLTVRERPEIVADPISQTVCEGAAVTFSVNAGLTTNPTYQWYKGVTAIPSATASTYTIPTATTTDAGGYYVIVSGACSSPVTSATAALTVDTPPVITTQPLATQSLCEGATASFSVVATGTSLTYQWRKNGVDIGGANSATYSISNIAAADNATYTVIVSGVCSAPISSTGSVLNVQEQPEIITNPVSQTVCAGSPVTFTVNAGVTTNATYQWYKGATLIGGATSATYTIPSTVPTDAGGYRVIVSGVCSPSATSTTAALTVNTAPAITTQPLATQSICEGSSASFSVVASGTTLSYQWRKNGVNIGGAPSATYSLTNISAADNGTYTVTVSGICGTPVTSIGSVLNVQEKPEIITGPVAQVVCAGSPVTFSVNAGATTSPSYQWYKDGSPIGGATSATYTIASAATADAGAYMVEVTGVCTPLASSSATLTVNTAPVITSQPSASQAICEGSNATFTVVATGTGLTYQWRKNGVNIASANAATYIISGIAAADAATYTVVITGTCGTPITSSASVLTVREKPEIVTQPLSQAICAGNSVTFTVNAGLTTNPTYQWFKDGSPIGGANASSYTIATTTTAHAGNYTVDVGGVCSPAVSSTAATLTVNTSPVITTQPVASQAICEDSPASFSVVAAGTGLLYQWRKNGVDIAGANAATYNIGTLVSADAGTYTVVITGTCTPAITSTASVLTVREKPEIIAQPGSLNLCEGSAATFTVNAGVTTNVAYQWYKGASAIASANAATYTIPSVTVADAGSYTVTVSGVCSPSITSSPATLAVKRNPTAMASDAAICSGQTTSVAITNPNAVPGTTFTWSIQSVTNVTGAAGGSGATIAQTLSSADGNNPGLVTYLIRPVAAGCIGPDYAVTVTVNPIPNIAASGQTICAGTSTSVAITNPNGVAGTSFTWTVVGTPSHVVGTGPGSGTMISQVLTLDDGVTPGSVTYRITPKAGTCQGSFVDVVVNVNPTPQVNNPPASMSADICSGATLNFLATSLVPSTTFGWTSSTIGILSGVTSAGTGVISDTPVNLSNATAYVIYTITPSKGSCAGNPVFYVVSVRPVPNATATPQTICSGQTTSIAITNPNGVTGTTFTWTATQTNATGASNGAGPSIAQTLYSANNLTNGTVTYTITPWIGTCPGTPFNVTATVKPTPVMTNSAASLSQQICSGVPLSFVPTATISSTFNWTGAHASPVTDASVTDSGSGNITDTPVNTGSVIGDAIYRITPVANGCSGLPVDFVVRVKPIPSATASNVTICSGSTALINITDAPKAVAGTTFSWIAATGNVTGAQPGNGSTISQVLTSTATPNGSVLYTITPTANGCNGPLTYVTATVNPVATVDAGIDFAVCEPTTIPVSGLIGGSATNGTWTIVSGGGSISSSLVSGSNVSATYTVNALADIGNTVTLRLNTNDPDAAGPCVNVNDNVVIKVNRKARVTVPANYTVCEPSNITLAGTLSGSATSGQWTVVSGAGVLSVSSVTNNDVTASYAVPLADVTQVLKFQLTTNDPDGPEPCVAESAVVDITVNRSAKVNAGADMQVCEYQSVTLAGSYADSPLVTWSGSPAGQFSNINNPTAVYTLRPIDITNGGVSLTLTASDPDGAGPCANVSDVVFVKVNKRPDVFLFDLDADYAENDPIDFLTGIPSGGTFTGAGIIAGTNQFDPGAAPIGPVSVTYMYTDGNACTNSVTKLTVVNPVTDIDFFIEKQTVDGSGNIQVCANYPNALGGKLMLIGDPSVNDPDAKSPTFFSSLAIPDAITSVTDALGTTYYLETQGLAPGTYDIQYTYTNQLSATATLTKWVTILPAPTAVINISQTCIEDAVTFADASTVDTNLTSIAKYAWDYGEAGNGNDGITRNPTYTYQSSGLKTISLTVTTAEGCTNTDVGQLRVGPVPTVDFTWSKVCSQLETTEFKDLSSAGGFSTISQYDWNFGDGSTINGPANGTIPAGDPKTSGIYNDPHHAYTSNQTYDVTLTVTTNDGCTNARTQKVYILDYKTPIAGNGYFDNFESGVGSWVAVETSSSQNSWIFGPPGGNVIQPAPASPSAWWTGANANAATDLSTYYNNESSYVMGPCLNLASLKRPMVSLDYWVDTQEGFDGAVLQYSVDGGATWETVGNADGYGIEWYNKRDISSEPGGQDNFAWSSGDPLKQWRNARFNLDKIPVAKRALVVFRIAFASNDDNDRDDPVRDGFAFDNIYIGEKNRNVLVEHFTNDDNGGPRDQSDAFLQDVYDQQFTTKDSSDFILVQYHMSRPGFDRLNADNPQDPEARSLFYGVSQPPATIMDGIQGQYFNTNFTGSYAKITADEIDRRALEDPLFDISIDSATTAGGNDTHMRPRVTFTYTDATKTLAAPVILQVALIEYGVNNNGNVVRKLLLGSEGRTVNKTWASGDVELATIEYTVDVPIVNADNLYLVAFIQEQTGTHRMLQSAIVKTGRKKGLNVVGVEDPIAAELQGLSLYPNPASRQLNILSDVRLSKDYAWTMIDQRGVAVQSGTLKRDFTSGPQTVDVSGLANGIYFMAIQTGEATVVYRKVAVMNRN